MKTISSLIITMSILISCDNSVDENFTVFIPSTPELLINKIYYHSKDLNSTFLIGDYTYNSANNLTKRISYNPTSSLVSITQTYAYENGKVIRCDFSEVTANNKLNNPVTTIYHDLYFYNDNGFLNTIQRYRGENEPISTNFEYNTDGKIIKSYSGTIDTEICESYPGGNLYDIDPILWNEYNYDNNDNVISTFSRHCNNDSEIKITYDNKMRPSDGLDYVPRTNLLPLISQYAYYSQSLSKGNVINDHSLMAYKYEYNKKGFPIIIYSYYNGEELSSFEIEYKTPK